MITVEAIMTPNPITIRPETPLSEIVEIMKSHGFRHLPVMSHNHLVGIVTDRDIRLAMNSPFIPHDRAEDEEVLRTLTAKDCMTAEPTTICYDKPATLAADIMRTHKFGALPVLKDGELAGIVTVSDILRSFMDQLS
jgi:acetoin utilization protein AcuB